MMSQARPSCTGSVSELVQTAIGHVIDPTAVLMTVISARVSVSVCCLWKGEIGHLRERNCQQEQEFLQDSAV